MSLTLEYFFRQSEVFNCNDETDCTMFKGIKKFEARNDKIADSNICPKTAPIDDETKEKLGKMAY